MSTAFLDLPVGVEEMGRVLRRVEVRKLKGKMQRDVARLAAKKRPNPEGIIQTILQPSIVSLDGRPTRIEDLRGMPMGDSDWLLFELRKLTWGPEVTATVECKACVAEKQADATATYLIDLNEELKTTSVPADAPWWDGEQILTLAEAGARAPDLTRRYCRVLQLASPDHQVEAYFRYGTGRDREALGKYAEEPLEALWKLMAMTCVSWRDPEHGQVTIPPKGLSEDFWEDLDADVLGWAQAAFAEATPGVDTSITVNCSHGHSQKTQLQPINFFFPEVRQMS